MRSLPRVVTLALVSFMLLAPSCKRAPDREPPKIANTNEESATSKKDDPDAWARTRVR
jgi:hypothetical protein